MCLLHRMPFQIHSLYLQTKNHIACKVTLAASMTRDKPCAYRTIPRTLKLIQRCQERNSWPSTNYFNTDMCMTRTHFERWLVTLNPIECVMLCVFGWEPICLEALPRYMNRWSCSQWPDCRNFTPKEIQIMGGHETYFYVASCTFNWNYYPTDCPRLFILLLCHRSQHLFEFCTFANSCSMFHKLYMYWGRGGTYYCNLFAARTAPQCNCIERLRQGRDK